MLLLLLRHSANPGSRTRKLKHAALAVLLVILCAASLPCRAQQQHYLCSDGFGYFSTNFHTGVTVTVSASKSGGFAAHTCDATLRWKKGVLPVVRGAWKVDIDVLGADLGFHTPVVAFQIRKSYVDRLATYRIYSLQKPPRLLATITGGDYYDAQDYSLDNHVAIWTDDASAFANFEGLPLYGFEYPPTVALRFDKNRLIDVSSEYLSYYDKQIAAIQSQLTPQALRLFRSSDGTLSSPSDSLSSNLHTLIRTKIKVLEIVWDYLYSGREQQAWNTLAQMWPASDLTRIRAAIQNAQAHGILRQVASIQPPSTRRKRKRHAMVYDMVTQVRQVVGVSSTAVSTIAGQLPVSPDATSNSGPDDPNAIVKRNFPVPIYLASPPPEDTSLSLPESRIYFNLVIDAAGKVRSATLVNKADAGPIADTEIRASKDWKFIPAFRAGRPVACRIQFGVAPYQ